MQKQKLKLVLGYISYLTGKSLNSIGRTRLNAILWPFESVFYLKTGQKPIDGTFVKTKSFLKLVGLDEAVQECLYTAYKSRDFRDLSFEEREFLAALSCRICNCFPDEVKRQILSLFPLISRKKVGEKLNPLMILSCFKQPPAQSDIDWAKQEIKALKEKSFKGGIY